MGKPWACGLELLAWLLLIVVAAIKRALFPD